MKTTINHIMGKAWLGLAALALPLASCSDWDDHYDPSTGDEGSKTTLWQAISSQSELSNFARVLKGCDYDRNLSGSQTYTVFALTNDGLPAEIEARQKQYEYYRDKLLSFEEKI